MSRYIGKRVSYPCYNCGMQCTINSKTVEIEGGIMCSDCSARYRAAAKIILGNLKGKDGK